MESVLANSQSKCVKGCVVNRDPENISLEYYVIFLLWKTKGGNHTLCSFLPFLSLLFFPSGSCFGSCIVSFVVDAQ